MLQTDCRDPDVIFRNRLSNPLKPEPHVRVELRRDFADWKDGTSGNEFVNTSEILRSVL